MHLAEGLPKTSHIYLQNIQPIKASAFYIFLKAKHSTKIERANYHPDGKNTIAPANKPYNVFQGSH